MSFKIETDSNVNYKNGVEFFLQTNKALETATIAHIHNAIEIIFVNSGSFVVYANEEKHEIFTNDMILFRSNTIHHIFAGDNEENSYYVLKTNPELLRDLAPPNMKTLYLLNFVFKNNNAKIIWKYSEWKNISEIVYGFESLKSEYTLNKQYEDIALKLAAGSVLLGILRSDLNDINEFLPENSYRTADCIYKAISYINTNYKNDITETEVSRAVGLSYHYFSRSFKHITGRTFKDYLNTVRINHAERLLTTTDKTASTVCFECGYKDLSYFIKVYKKFKQTSPGKIKFFNL